MKFICNYTELLSGLEKVAIVAEDANSSEDIKNVIFRFEKQDDNLNVCTLVGVNATITYKHILAYDKYRLQLEDDELTDRTCFMQIKCKELLNFLNAYKSVRRTIVEEVTFEFKDKVQIKCSVLEYSNDDNKIPYVSIWLFNNIPIKPNMLPSINAKPLNRPIDIDKDALRRHINTLLPIITGQTSIYSQLVFGNDYIVAFNNAFVALMKNTLIEGHIFENMRLHYKVLAFLDKVICNQDEIKAAKSDTQIYIKTDKSEAYLTYDPRITEYETYLNMYNKGSGFCVDRLLLKDVLKRLSLENESIDVTLKPTLNVINVRNSKFTQDIPLLKEQGLENLEDFGFRIMPDILNRAFIGTDTAFSSNSYIYLAPQDSGVTTLIFMDDTDSWYSVARVKNISKAKF